MSTIEQLTADEKAVLIALTHCGSADLAYPFKAIASLLDKAQTAELLPYEMTFDRDAIRTACLGLKAHGLVKFYRGLWDVDEDQPAGSGYGLTNDNRAMTIADRLVRDKAALTHSTELERYYRAEAICLLGSLCRSAAEFREAGNIEAESALRYRANVLREIIDDADNGQRLRGICGVCAKPIEPGSIVKYYDDLGEVHAKCGPEDQEAIEQRLPNTDKIYNEAVEYLDAHIEDPRSDSAKDKTVIALAAGLALFHAAKAFRDLCDKSVFASVSDANWQKGTELDSAISRARREFEAAGILEPETEETEA